MTTSDLIDRTRPRVLFVDRNGGSTQVAASLLRRVAGERITVRTAITEPADPGGRSDEMLVAMGLNPADDQRLSSGALHTADVVVVLGTGLDVARLPGPHYEEWDLSDDDLVRRVQALNDELTAVPTLRLGLLDRLCIRLGITRRP